MKIKIEVLEPLKFTLYQTGEVIEFEVGIHEMEKDLRTQRIIAQNKKKIKIIKDEKK